MEREIKNYKIFHSAEIGDQSVHVEAHIGIDVIRAAVYCQFASEIYYSPTALLTSLGIASALVAFYGCQHAAKKDDAIRGAEPIPTISRNFEI
jgi:hypothetical protein